MQLLAADAKSMHEEEAGCSGDMRSSQARAYCGQSGIREQRKTAASGARWTNFRRRRACRDAVGAARCSAEERATTVADGVEEGACGHGEKSQGGGGALAGG
jgi:hypothetical protein